MKTKKLLLLIVPMLLMMQEDVTSQSLADIKNKYPGYDAVVLNYAESYRISLENDEPKVESNQKEQIYFISPNAASYMSQYSFVHSGFHEVKDYHAYTKTADRRKLRVSDFKTTDNKSGGIFYDDVKETTFDFPGITPGAVGNLELNTIHKDAHLLSPFYFSRRVPVIKAELRISFPKDMRIRYFLRGIDTSDIHVSLRKSRNEWTYIFTATDLPAEKEYADAPKSPYFSRHVIFYIDSYYNKEGELIHYLGRADDLYKLNAGFVQSVNHQPDQHLSHTVDSLIAGVSSDRQKAKKIYRWVQNHIKYVAFEEGMEGFIPRDANLVYKRRFGDCKDMSSILTQMLNLAHLHAYYTWIGTRDLPYKYSEIPTPIVDNHMICTLMLNGENIFLDGTDPTCIFGMPSEGIQGKEALIALDEKNYRIVQVPVPEATVNAVVDSTFLQCTEKGLSGKISIHLKGYEAMDVFGLLLYTGEKDRKKYFTGRLSRGSNKFLLQDYHVDPSPDKDAVAISANFLLEDYGRSLDGEYFINLNLFRFFEHQEIDYPARKIPIEYPYRFTKKFVTVFTIPDGYKVSYLPPPSSFHNKVWGFDLKYEQKGQTVIFSAAFDNNHLLLQPSQFKEWNEVLEHLFPNYKESIALKKQ